MDLSNYTKDMILSDEVFLTIFEEQNELSRARLINEFSQQAKKLGVKKDFDRIFNAYRKEIHSGNIQGSFGHVTDFESDEYPDMRCGEWIANGQGIFCLSMFNQQQWACTHPILPVKTLVNAQTHQAKTVIAYKLRGKWTEAVVDRSVLASNSKIVQLADRGIRVTSENARALVRYLADVEGLNEDIIPSQLSTSKLGWTSSGFMPYRDDLLFDSEDAVYTVYESVTEKGDADQWLDFMRRLRSQRKTEVLLYLAGSFASPLLEKLNMLPFIIDLYGETGNGKTVALMAALSVWANPEMGKYMIKADSTNVSIEVLLDLLNNLPAGIDDFSQLQRKLQGDFSSYVYMMCSGMGRLRSNTRLGIQPVRKWHNIILTNSERSLVTETMQGGAINRIIEYESTDVIFDRSEGNQTVTFLRDHYGTCGRRYIEVLEEIGFDEIKALQQSFAERIRQQMRNLGIEKEEKQIAPMSVLMAADQIATDYIFRDGVYLNFDECFDMLKNHEEVSETERAYSRLLDEIQVHANNFKPEETRGEIWGEFKQGGSYVAILNSVFGKLCDASGTSAASFKKWAAGKDLIKTDADGKYTTMQRLNGKLTRCVMLKIEEPEDDTESKFIPIDDEIQQELPFY